MTHSEENYLKVIYHLSGIHWSGVATNAIAKSLQTKASSVTDMVKKLADKGYVNYQKYHGVELTEKGAFKAKMIVRKHRLWEVFLVEKLQFSWDEVHEIAEELEHVQSEKLIQRLDTFLNFPHFDPHGDPIPNENGEIMQQEKKLLSEGTINQEYVCVGVKDTSTHFLQYLNQQLIEIGSILKITHKEPYDQSLKITTKHTEITISEKIANNLYIKLI